MQGTEASDIPPRGRAPLAVPAGAWFQRDGAAFVLAFLPVVLAAWAYGYRAVLGEPAVGVPVAVATLLLLVAGLLHHRRRPAGRPLVAAGLLLLLGLLVPALSTSPPAALATAAATALLLFQALKKPVGDAGVAVGPEERAASRSRSAGALALLLLIVVSVFHRVADPFVEGGTAAACGAAAMFALHWVRRARSRRPRVMLVVSAFVLGALLLLGSDWAAPSWLLACLLWTVAALAAAAPAGVLPTGRSAFWDPIVFHPARLLLSTFLAIAILGGLLLAMPWATTRAAPLQPVDAAFTSVSAVCVTGLIVVDTPKDLTVAGQLVVLLLIQVGGLGIMSITTVVLHALGRRLSLRHESLLVGMGAESRHRLVDALRRVVVFAFTTEAVGAVLLALLFSSRGEAIRSAIYRGIFTSVSAFCNAGFALQTDSLVGYQHSPLVLHVVAALIVLGGLSPVAAMSIPRLLRRRRLQPAVKIVLVVTLLLLVGGALGYAIFEWHDSLAGLGILDHLHNAWFQSVTLRTAGFNSVDTALTRPETRLLMMCLMFIGGSPGGTAGGIKTTTFAVLVLAVWTAISGRNRVLVGGREIRHPTLVRAVAALGSGVLMWLLTVVFLLLTQRIPAEHLVFEATSALGTVGLSTGATPFLDATGKSIIIAAMFLGRVGPLTLFTLLGETRRQRTVDYPEATIPIA